MRVFVACLLFLWCLLWLGCLLVCWPCSCLYKHVVSYGLFCSVGVCVACCVIVRVCLLSCLMSVCLCCSLFCLFVCLLCCIVEFDRAVCCVVYRFVCVLFVGLLAVFVLSFVNALFIMSRW